MNDLKSLVVQSVEYSDVIAKNTNAIRDLVRRALSAATPLEDDYFHDLAALLRSLILKKGDPCEEFVRRVVAYTPDKNFDITFDECVAFVAAYGKMVSRLGSALTDVDTERGDDSFSDLIDALPLAPKEMLDELFANPKSFLDWEHKHRASIANLLDGEFYIFSRLRDALATFFPHVGRDLRPAQKSSKSVKSGLAYLQIKQSSNPARGDLTEIVLNLDDASKIVVDVKAVDFLKALTQSGASVSVEYVSQA